MEIEAHKAIVIDPAHVPALRKPPILDNPERVGLVATVLIVHHGPSKMPPRSTETSSWA